MYGTRDLKGQGLPITQCFTGKAIEIKTRCVSREEDTRTLLRQIYETEIDLVPDLQTNTLTVRLHHLTQAAHDEAVRHLCHELNATETLFPGTDLKLVYQLGSS